MYMYMYIFAVPICVIRLQTPPETLDQLGNSLLLLEQLQGEVEATENEFEPLRYVYIHVHTCTCLHYVVNTCIYIPEAAHFSENDYLE